MSNCCCGCGYTNAINYNAYDNFCDPFRYSSAVDGKYIKYNQHSCLNCRNKSCCGRKKGKDKDKGKCKSKYVTKWSGIYPDPYRGVWTLYKNGKDISHLIPTHLRAMPMYTYGEYPVYYLQPGHCIESYVCDGLHAPEWIRHNLYWLMLIADDDLELSSLYEAFHANDWRFAPIAPRQPEFWWNCVPGYEF